MNDQSIRQGLHGYRKKQVSQHIISQRAFNLIIGLVLCWGFGVNYLMLQTIPTEMIAAIHPIAFICLYIASAFFGTFLFNMSDNAIVSFIGYNFVVVPLGLVVNLVVSQYDPFLVHDAVLLTGMITGVMMALGTLYPRFFLAIGNALVAVLLALITAQMISVFLFDYSIGLYSVGVAIVFSGFIAHDWAKANAMERTLDNAVDAAANLYINIINLFVQILNAISGD
ncbi:Bax inhibitor-1 family protein [Aliivibrio salmonicida]|uniref:Bax inhibitor-1 family protein n=1 Tax=Aliivibrio salmonicida TaxID=40269 RepID=UPI003D0D5886